MWNKSLPLPGTNDFIISSRTFTHIKGERRRQEGGGTKGVCGKLMDFLHKVQDASRVH